MLKKRRKKNKERYKVKRNKEHMEETACGL
jgi:hypothetical protein